MSTHQNTNTSPDSAGDGSCREFREDSSEEITLLDILVVLARSKTTIIYTVVSFTVLFGVYALLSSNEYTSEAKVVREIQEDTPSLGGSLSGGLGALQGLGINLGSGASGLTAAAFPDVLQSREVRLGVIRDTIQFSGDVRMTFTEYANQPMGPVGLFLRYTVGLPELIRESLFKTGDEFSSGKDKGVLTDDEWDALKAVAEKVTTDVNQETGIMSIKVTAEYPNLAAGLAQSFVDHLTTRVREVRTGKIRQRLNFVQVRFEEVGQELEHAENRLANFLERNQNPTTASLQFQRERLQRQVRFKEQLYSDLQGQLTQTRLDLQRQQPVLTVVESPVPPDEPSSPGNLLLLLVGAAFGLVAGIGGAFLSTYFQMSEEHPEEQGKLEEVRRAFGKHGWKRTIRQRLGLGTSSDEVNRPG